MSSYSIHSEDISFSSLLQKQAEKKKARRRGKGTSPRQKDSPRRANTAQNHYWSLNKSKTGRINRRLGMQTSPILIQEAAPGDEDSRSKNNGAQRSKTLNQASFKISRFSSKETVKQVKNRLTVKNFCDYILGNDEDGEAKSSLKSRKLRKTRKMLKKSKNRAQLQQRTNLKSEWLLNSGHGMSKRALMHEYYLAYLYKKKKKENRAMMLKNQKHKELGDTDAILRTKSLAKTFKKVKPRIIAIQKFNQLRKMTSRRTSKKIQKTEFIEPSILKSSKFRTEEPSVNPLSSERAQIRPKTEISISDSQYEKLVRRAYTDVNNRRFVKKRVQKNSLSLGITRKAHEPDSGFYTNRAINTYTERDKGSDGHNATAPSVSASNFLLHNHYIGFHKPKPKTRKLLNISPKKKSLMYKNLQERLESTSKAFRNNPFLSKFAGGAFGQKSRKRGRMRRVRTCTTAHPKARLQRYRKKYEEALYRGEEGVEDSIQAQRPSWAEYGLSGASLGTSRRQGTPYKVRRAEGGEEAPGGLFVGWDREMDRQIIEEIRNCSKAVTTDPF